MCLLQMIAKGRDCTNLFPAVVKNVVSKNPEVSHCYYCCQFEKLLCAHVEHLMVKWLGRPAYNSWEYFACTIVSWFLSLVSVFPPKKIKKLVYVYLVRYAEEQQDLALLSISTFQKALKVGERGR